MFKTYLKYTYIVLYVLVLTFITYSVHQLRMSQKACVEEYSTMQVDTLQNREIYIASNPFTPSIFKDYLTEVNVKFPEIVYAQAVIESGNFSSSLFLNHNNPFGMKIAKQRPTLNNGGHPIYASYYSWQHSVLDYAYFQSRFMKAYDTQEKYLNRLSQIYAEDPTYIDKLKKVINE